MRLYIRHNKGVKALLRENKGVSGPVSRNGAWANSYRLSALSYRKKHL